MGPYKSFCVFMDSTVQALSLNQPAVHFTSFHVKLQLYCKWICKASFLLFQMTYSSNDLEMNPSAYYPIICIMIFAHDIFELN